MVTAYSAMVTQYSTGVFRLGRINAVDEGLPGYAIFCFIAPFLNFDFLNQYHWYAPLNVEIIALLLVLLQVQLFSISKTIPKNRVKRKREVTYLILSPIFVGGALLAIYFFGPVGIYNEIYYYMSYTLCFLWGRNNILIQLCFVT